MLKNGNIIVNNGFLMYVVDKAKLIGFADECYMNEGFDWFEINDNLPCHSYRFDKRLWYDSDYVLIGGYGGETVGGNNGKCKITISTIDHYFNEFFEIRNINNDLLFLIDINSLTDDLKRMVARELWNSLEDVPMNPETECIEVAWNIFDIGTNRIDIWNWFIENFPVTIQWLMYEE